MNKIQKMINKYASLTGKNYRLNSKHWHQGLRYGWTMTPFGETEIWLGANVADAVEKLNESIMHVESLRVTSTETEPESKDQP